jgi:hypothetical protein
LQNHYSGVNRFTSVSFSIHFPLILHPHKSALVYPTTPFTTIKQITLFQADTKGTTQNQNRATKNTTPQIACFSVQLLSKSLQSRFFEKTGITTLFGRVAGC